MVLQTADKRTLSGRVYNFKLGNTNRLFTNTTIPFKLLKEISKVYRYSAETDDGEQRAEKKAHINQIRREVDLGNYTPCALTIGLRESHKSNLQMREVDGENMFWLELDNLTEQLAILDGQHREKVFETYQESDQELDELPVPVTILFDGISRHDFLNLQKGSSVDRAQIMSMNTSERSAIDPTFGIAMKAARILHKDEKSPIYRQVRFDSQSEAVIPISSICTKGASDLATSLVGGAKIADFLKLNEDDLSTAIIEVYQKIKSVKPNLLEQTGDGNKKMLMPPPDGTKGGGSFLIGLGNIWLYARTHGIQLIHFVEVVERWFDAETGGNMSGPTKRYKIRDFVRDLFRGTEVALHEGVPTDFVRVWAPSSFGNITKLPSEQKPRGRPTGSKNKAKSEVVTDETQNGETTESPTVTETAPVVTEVVQTKPAVTKVDRRLPVGAGK